MAITPPNGGAPFDTYSDKGEIKNVGKEQEKENIVNAIKNGTDLKQVEVFQEAINKLLEDNGALNYAIKTVKDLRDDSAIKVKKIILKSIDNEKSMACKVLNWLGFYKPKAIDVSHNIWYEGAAS